MTSGTARSPPPSFEGGGEEKFGGGGVWIFTRQKGLISRLCRLRIRRSPPRTVPPPRAPLHSCSVSFRSKLGIASTTVVTHLSGARKKAPRRHARAGSGACAEA